MLLSGYREKILELILLGMTLILKDLMLEIFLIDMECLLLEVLLEEV